MTNHFGAANATEALKNLVKALDDCEEGDNINAELMLEYAIEDAREMLGENEKKKAA